MVKIVAKHTSTSEILLTSFLLEMKKKHVVNITVNEFCSQFSILVSLGFLHFAISFCAW